MYILDVEASGFDPESYPIEVAFTNLKTGESDQFLINPGFASDWDYWSEAAERVHGISLDALSRSGVSPCEALYRLEKLSNQQVFTDAPRFDELWLARLYDEMQDKPRYMLQDIRSLVAKENQEAMEREMETISPPHRAMADVEMLVKLVRRYT